MTSHCSTCNRSNIIQDGDMYEMAPRPFGSYYYIIEEFECFNPCKDCKRRCDKCEEVGEIETVICYYCDTEVANCQVFTCPNYRCEIPKCVKCAKPDYHTGACLNCFADMCDAQTEWELDCQC